MLSDVSKTDNLYSSFSLGETINEEYNGITVPVNKALSQRFPPKEHFVPSDLWDSFIKTPVTFEKKLESILPFMNNWIKVIK